MTFIPIDRSRWDREEYFSYFSHEVPCLYSMTLNLDVTPVMKRKERPYPAMLYFLSVVENRHKRYRISFNEKGELGYYDVVHPSYTIFHKDDHTFSSLWTEYSETYDDFLASYEADEARYGKVKGLFGNLTGRPTFSPCLSFPRCPSSPSISAFPKLPETFSPCTPWAGSTGREAITTCPWPWK